MREKEKRKKKCSRPLFLVVLFRNVLAEAENAQRHRQLFLYGGEF
jgi:hypothetical protein